MHIGDRDLGSAVGSLTRLSGTSAFRIAFIVDGHMSVCFEMNFEWYPVNEEVGNLRNKGEYLIKPIT